MYTVKGQASQPPYLIVSFDPCVDPQLIYQPWTMSQPFRKFNLLLHKPIL